MDAALGRIRGSAAGETATRARGDFVAADIRFHLAIAAICGNPVLVKLLESVLGLLRPALMDLPWNEERRRVTQAAHEAVYEALLQGDVDAAGRVMQEHVRLAADGLLKRVWSEQGAGRS